MADGQAVIPRSTPLFPLPGVVLFPQMLLPLHIFEPRYRDMIADALQGDRIIAVALLRPGFEPYYYTRHAPVYDVAGVGRVVAAEPAEEGKFNILVQGITRARVLAESTQRSYRIARVEAIPPECGASPEVVQERAEALLELVSNEPRLDLCRVRRWRELLSNDLTLTDAIDLIAAELPVEAELRQCFLDERRVAERLSMLIEQIKTLSAVVQTRFRMPNGRWCGN